MDSVQRLTVNLPAKLLKDAMACSKKNKTKTLILGLEELLRRNAYQEIRKFRGKIPLKLNLKRTRKSRV